LSGCAKEGGPGLDPSDPPAEELSRSVDSTLSAQSFRVTVARVGDSEGDSQGWLAGASIDYQAPDSFALFLGEGDHVDPSIIVVGPDTYLADASNPQHFVREPSADGSLWAYPFFVLRILQEAVDVSREGDVLSFTASMPGSSSQAISGQARLSGGLVREVTIDLGEGQPRSQLTFLFDSFGEVRQVAAPPEESIVTGVPFPSCGPDGAPPEGVAVCMTASPSPLAAAASD